MEEKLSKSNLVFITTSKIVRRLSESLNTSNTKAILSKLRNSIGRPLNENIEGIKLIYEYMPEELYREFSTLTYEELAILTTLQLYSIHQQSKMDSVNAEEKTGSWNNIGESFSSLRGTEGNEAFDRRFNALITSQSFEELSHHLRQLLKILKSKQENIKVNYPKLSKDLYDFKRGYDERVRLNWSRAYYSIKFKGEDKNEK